MFYVLQLPAELGMFDPGMMSLEEVVDRLASPDPEVRLHTVERLGVASDPSAVEPIRKLLRDPVSKVRVQAILALIRMGYHDGLFLELINALQSTDRCVAMGAALVLGRLGDSRAVHGLLTRFKTNDTQLGAALAWALGRCKDPSAIPLLAAAIKHGFVASQACEALGQIGELRGFDALVVGLTASAPEVRGAAARALGALKYEGPKGEESANLAKSHLAGMLKDPIRSVRLSAAVALEAF